MDSLDECCFQGDTTIVKALLGSSADLNADDEYGRTPLICAARKGNTDVFKILLNNGAEVDWRSNDGWTPLAYASRYGRSKAVTALVNSGANVNAKTGDGSTSLEFALRQEHSEVIRLLIEAGAKHGEALALVIEGENLAQQGMIKDAMAAYTNARSLNSTFTISAPSWNTLYWLGTLWGYDANVMTAYGERAVALAPDNGNFRDSRGVARALIGDFAGAIADFESFVAWTSDDQARAQRQEWIDALRAGENPFTPELLKTLRAPSPS